jgi:uncharacterized membrane protein YdbT with pleckstrin-like domain
MGQAKARGTRDQRVHAACIKKEEQRRLQVIKQAAEQAEFAEARKKKQAEQEAARLKHEELHPGEPLQRTHTRNQRLVISTTLAAASIAAGISAFR